MFELQPADDTLLDAIASGSELLVEITGAANMHIPLKGVKEALEDFDLVDREANGIYRLYAAAMTEDGNIWY